MVAAVRFTLGLMGLKAAGNDHNAAAVAAAKKNLRHYKISASITQKDATKINTRHPYVVTDLPYGRSTVVARNFYPQFLSVLEKMRPKRAVIIFPSNYDYKKAIAGTSLKIKAAYKHYIHKSLSKVIVVLEKN